VKYLPALRSVALPKNQYHLSFQQDMSTRNITVDTFNRGFVKKFRSSMWQD